MNGKGSDRRPERVAGSYASNWEAVFKGRRAWILKLIRETLKSGRPIVLQVSGVSRNDLH